MREVIIGALWFIIGVIVSGFFRHYIHIARRRPKVYFMPLPSELRCPSCMRYVRADHACKQQQQTQVN